MSVVVSAGGLLVVSAFLAVAPCVVLPVVVVGEAVLASSELSSAHVLLVPLLLVPWFWRSISLGLYLAGLSHLPSCRGVFTLVNNAMSAERLLVVLACVRSSPSDDESGDCGGRMALDAVASRVDI